MGSRATIRSIILPVVLLIHPLLNTTFSIISHNVHCPGVLPVPLLSDNGVLSLAVRLSEDRVQLLQLVPIRLGEAEVHQRNESGIEAEEDEESLPANGVDHCGS